MIRIALLFLLLPNTIFQLHLLPGLQILCLLQLDLLGGLWVPTCASQRQLGLNSGAGEPGLGHCVGAAFALFRGVPATTIPHKTRFLQKKTTTTTQALGAPVGPRAAALLDLHDNYLCTTCELTPWCAKWREIQRQQGLRICVVSKIAPALRWYVTQGLAILTWHKPTHSRPPRLRLCVFATMRAKNPSLWNGVTEEAYAYWQLMYP